MATRSGIRTTTTRRTERPLSSNCIFGVGIMMLALTTTFLFRQVKAFGAFHKGPSSHPNHYQRHSRLLLLRPTHLKVSHQEEQQQEPQHQRTLQQSPLQSSQLPQSFLSNADLAQRRLEQFHAKRAVREQDIQDRVDRNLRIKRLLHNKTSTTTTTTISSNDDEETSDEKSSISPPPPLYAVKIWVDNVLREELKLTGREKRGRLFIESENTHATSTLPGLRQELYGFFRALRKNTFMLTANLPLVVADNGTVEVVPPDNPHANGTWPIQSDDDVVQTFLAADTYFHKFHIQNASNRNLFLQRPSIQINVWKDPNAPPPPPPPTYLNHMADPNQSKTMTMLSFYAFPPDGIADPEDFALELRKLWKPFQALGRVYVATEGVNAQMSVPTNVLENFMQCCRSIPELGTYMENDINIDPQPLTREEFAVAGVSRGGEPSPPFRNLHVRVRTQIVADGLDKALDWQSAGYDCPPLEWHQRLQEARKVQQQQHQQEPSQDPSTSSEDKTKTITNTNTTTQPQLPILLDCRNAYETDIGMFDGAEPLNTENFRQTWDVLEKRLADTPKDAPIMTYCTGGIRCVKVGAYLTQTMGFTNVSRLAGGIIAYDRALQEKQHQEQQHQEQQEAQALQDNGESLGESLFKGTNFVFDGRLGRPITEDALGVCLTCGSETSMVSNCRNDNCHQRMIQCEKCRTSFHGACSEACKNRILNGAMAPKRRNSSLAKATFPSGGETTKVEPKQFSSLADYSLGHSSPVPSIYQEMEWNTQSHLPSGAHMVSGAAQGRLLTQLASMTREGRILELGTFTGYATACFLEGAHNVAQVITGDAALNGGSRRDSGPYVMSMERDERAFALAAAHVRTIAEYGFSESAADRAASFRTSVPEIEGNLVSVIMDNGRVGCDLLKVTDALAMVESMSQGGGSSSSSDMLLKPSPAPFDLVFVDADKTRLLDYVEVCLKNDKILKRGGWIVVDNVLWKGLVLDAAAASLGQFKSAPEEDGSIGPDIDDEDQDQASLQQLRKNRRARRLANQMHQFNAAIVQDDRVEVIMLPIRDGLSVIRKK